MTMRQRIQSWQSAAFHHALPYYGLALKMTPFALSKNFVIVKARAIQTRLRSPAGNIVTVTYKRRRTSQKVELNINGTRHYFGPDDAAAMRAVLRPI
jgi:hypothetical protein